MERLSKKIKVEDGTKLYQDFFIAFEKECEETYPQPCIEEDNFYFISDGVKYLFWSFCDTFNMHFGINRSTVISFFVKEVL